MGCDIHVFAEKKIDGRWNLISGDDRLFDFRSYGVFAFMANVRNYSGIKPFAEPRGLPQDISAEAREELDGYHSLSWLSVAELLAFDYNAPVEDLRVMRQVGPNSWSGAITAEPGEGKLTTYREFLGDAYFTELGKLMAMGAERIVFGFDN